MSHKEGNPYIQLYPLQSRQQYARSILSLQNKIPVVVTCSVWYASDYRCLIMDQRHTVQDLLHEFGFLDKFCGLNYITQEVLSQSTTLGEIQLSQDQHLYIHIGQIS